MTPLALLFWSGAIFVLGILVAWLFISIQQERRAAQAQMLKKLAEASKPQPVKNMQVIMKSGDRRARKPFEVTHCVIK